MPANHLECFRRCSHNCSHRPLSPTEQDITLVCPGPVLTHFGASRVTGATDDMTAILAATAADAAARDGSSSSSSSASGAGGSDVSKHGAEKYAAVAGSFAHRKRHRSAGHRWSKRRAWLPVGVTGT